MTYEPGTRVLCHVYKKWRLGVVQEPDPRVMQPWEIRVKLSLMPETVIVPEQRVKEANND